MVKRPIPYSVFNNSVPLKTLKLVKKFKKIIHGIRQLGMAFIFSFFNLIIKLY